METTTQSIEMHAKTVSRLKPDAVQHARNLMTVVSNYRGAALGSPEDALVVKATKDLKRSYPGVPEVESFLKEADVRERTRTLEEMTLPSEARFQSAE